MNMMVKKPNAFKHLQVGLETPFSLPYDKEIFMSNRKMPEAMSIPPWLDNFAQCALSKLMTFELCLARHHCRPRAWRQRWHDNWLALPFGLVSWGAWPHRHSGPGVSFFQGGLVSVHIPVLNSPDKCNVPSFLFPSCGMSACMYCRLLTSEQNLLLAFQYF